MPTASPKSLLENPLCPYTYKKRNALDELLFTIWKWINKKYIKDSIYKLIWNIKLQFKLYLFLKLTGLFKEDMIHV